MGSFRYANTCELLLGTSLESFQMKDAVWQYPSLQHRLHLQAAPLDLKHLCPTLMTHEAQADFARAKLLHITRQLKKNCLKRVSNVDGNARVLKGRHAILTPYKPRAD